MPAAAGAVRVSEQARCAECVRTGLEPPRAQARLERLRPVFELFEMHLAEDLSVPRAAGTVQMSPSHFRRFFKQTMGKSYVRYLHGLRVDRACELACLVPVIARLPAGLDTEITERGLNMSGGKKQRLALARGILASRDSSLIMLDEPTSSMDPVTEAKVYDNLLTEFPEACVVSSIHRLHLLTRFDMIVLMEDGRVIDSGSMTDLLSRHPAFKALWQKVCGERTDPAL